MKNLACSAACPRAPESKVDRVGRRWAIALATIATLALNSSAGGARPSTAQKLRAPAGFKVFPRSPYDYLTPMGAMRGPMSQRWAELFVDKLALHDRVPRPSVLRTSAAVRRIEEIIQRYSKPPLKAAITAVATTIPSDGPGLMARGLGYLEAFTAREPGSGDARNLAVASFRAVESLPVRGTWDSRDKLYAKLALASLTLDWKNRKRLLTEVGAGAARVHDRSIAFMAYATLAEQAPTEHERLKAARSALAKYRDFSNYTIYREVSALAAPKTRSRTAGTNSTR